MGSEPGDQLTDPFLIPQGLLRCHFEHLACPGKTLIDDRQRLEAVPGCGEMIRRRESPAFRFREREMIVGESTVGMQMEVQFESVRTEIVQEGQPLP